MGLPTPLKNAPTFKGKTMRKSAREEYGLMTLQEYLKHRNPKGKYHEGGAYSFSVESMNQDYSITPIQSYPPEFKVFGKNDKSAFYFCLDGKVRAVVAKGTIFYSYTREKDKILRLALSKGFIRSSDSFFYLRDFDLKEKKVKYPQDYMGFVSDKAKRNMIRYPHLLERFRNNGECFTVRSEEPLQLNKGTTIGIFNEEGFKVATAQDEWGTTLIGVAEEYRSRGLSKIVARYWHEYNPAYESGGFTPQGQEAAISYWAGVVRDLEARGFYEDKILSGEMTRQRADEILSSVPKKEKRNAPSKPKKIEPTGELLMFSDYPSFILYDKAFLKEQDDRFIYGLGLLRDSSDVGSFFYQLDYDRKYQDLVTRIGLQFAKDNGDTRLFDGRGDRYSDILEIEDIDGVRREGEYITLKRDLINYSRLVVKDRTLRPRIDPYSEIKILLQEQAYSKWS
jgi:hypothetical protein